MKVREFWGQHPNSRTFKPLNITARLVLLKSVLQTLPTYLFTALAAPKQIIRAIRNIQRNFLWYGSKDKKRMVLIAWEKICKIKIDGVLSIRSVRSMNKALFAK